MKGLLIDENLPCDLTLPTGLAIFHSSEFGANPSDTELWQRAARNRWVILTKDADFGHRILMAEPPPWIVHVRLGNLRLRDLNLRLSDLWPQIEELLPRHKLVTVLANRIEAIA